MTDYFEEKIINGVLCYRFSADTAYTPYTVEQLTIKLVKAFVAVRKYVESEDELIDEGGDCCGA